MWPRFKAGSDRRILLAEVNEALSGMLFRACAILVTVLLGNAAVSSAVHMAYFQLRSRRG